MKKKSEKTNKKSIKANFKPIREALYKSAKSVKVFILINAVIISLILTFILFQILDLYSQSSQKKAEYILQYQYWNQVAQKHSNYPDAYYNVALYAFRLSLIDKAHEYIEKALILDPEFTEALDLKSEIEHLASTGY